MLEVIGSGLGRTGTSSLKLALEQVGLGPCHHMVEVFRHPETIPLWLAVHAGDPDWDAVFKGYRSAVDHPASLYWRQLSEHYPGAKVLHTVRDPVAWFESTQATIFSPESRAIGQRPDLESLFQGVVKGFGGDVHDREFMLDFYVRHSQAVIDGMPKDRLLVFDVAQGWEPLCAFLGVAVPARKYARTVCWRFRRQTQGTPDIGAELT